MRVVQAVRAWVMRLWRETQDDGLFDVAAAVTFWVLLSLPALMLAVLSSVSLLGDGLANELEEVTLDFVQRTFADESNDLQATVQSLFDQPRSGLFSVSLAVALFTVSRGFAGLIRGLDVAYDIDDTRSFIRLRLAGLGLALGTLIVVAASTSLWVWTRDVGVPDSLRALAALAILIAWAATLFHIGPNHHTPWRFDLPGAAFTALGWLLLSVGYGAYIQVAGSGNSAVGIVGALLLGLTWMWLAVVVLLIGAEINGILAERAGVIERRSRFGTWMATTWQRTGVPRRVTKLRRRGAADDDSPTERV
ncbi:MAG: YihY/virulence factor BrkB family protein [Actinomycetota bacterium]